LAKDVSFLCQLVNLRVLNVQGANFALKHLAVLQHLSKIYLYGSTFNYQKLPHLLAKGAPNNIDTGAVLLPQSPLDSLEFTRKRPTKFKKLDNTVAYLVVAL
jgi:hypothetical protein